MGNGRFFSCNGSSLASFFLTSVKLFEARKLANLTDWTRILLVANCAIDLAFEHLLRIDAYGDQEKTNNKDNPSKK